MPVSLLATLLCPVRFVHFFEGMRTNHEIQKCHALDNRQMKMAVDLAEGKIDESHTTALHLNHPILRGIVQSAGICVQDVDSPNSGVARVPDAIRQAMFWVKKLTGRECNLFRP